MQTYLIHWQFPDQKAHIKGANVFAKYVESGCESAKFEGFEVINRVVILKGLVDGRLSKHPITKQFGNGASLGVKDLGMMLRSFLFLMIVNILLFIKS